jgi:hypothetical protein
LISGWPATALGLSCSIVGSSFERLGESLGFWRRAKSEVDPDYVRRTFSVIYDKVRSLID